MTEKSSILDETILLKIYDTVRYVNPIMKKCSGNTNGFEEEAKLPHCFSAWEKNAVCENCISIRALKEKKTMMKLEYSDKKIFMVTAVPMNEYEKDDRVIELIRDVTHENLLEQRDLLNEALISEKINKLNRELISDPLTQLYNRRFMEERLPYEMVKSWSSKEPMGFILADIDFFKRINDTYGHLAGDEILVQFSKLLKENIREKQDWVIRYGGEEFLIFISNADEKTLYGVAETIRKKIEIQLFTHAETQLNITSSFGVYSVIPETVEDLEVLKTYIDFADKALYESKNRGRNRVSIFTNR